MRDQIGHKAKVLIKKAQRTYEAKERQDSYLTYKAEKRGVVFEPWDNITAHLCRRKAARCGDGRQRLFQGSPRHRRQRQAGEDALGHDAV